MAGFDVRLRTAVEEYDELGFDTLPLKPGSKDPYPRAWQSHQPYRMWRFAPPDANVGIRGGGDSRVAFLDCDEKTHAGTFEVTQSWLAGLGYSPGEYPVVRTASFIGRQIWLWFSGGLDGDYRLLHPNFGAGEFRYGPGSYVVAPPSLVESVSYTLLDGDYRQLPKVSLVDILPILVNQDTTPEKRLLKIPRHARALLQGKNIDHFKSRSEAEQSLLASLVNAGHDFESVLGLFLYYPCAGKFEELRTKSEKNARRWLRKSFDEAVRWTQSHESLARRTAQAALDWADSTPWPGRTGSVDRLVFIAHASIAYRAGRLIYAASCRDLAEEAGVTHMTASNATHRICAAGMLALDRKAQADCANIYRLMPHGLKFTLPHNEVLRECKSMSHDAFRWSGLGKSAGEVWQVLNDIGPLAVAELAKRTGRHPKTVRRALARMAALVDTVTGEFLPMVERDGDRWRAVEDVDLDHIAQIIGTAGIGKRQRERHRRERKAHRRSLVLGMEKPEK